MTAMADCDSLNPTEAQARDMLEEILGPYTVALAIVLEDRTITTSMSSLRTEESLVGERSSIRSTSKTLTKARHSTDTSRSGTSPSTSAPMIPRSP
jgi:hypothetical protein